MSEVKGAAMELGTERIRKLLMQYAVPAIIAMTASSLYNMVDSIFIGHGVGPLAISGLALTFPLMNLAAAFGSLWVWVLRRWCPCASGSETTKRRRTSWATSWC